VLPAMDDIEVVMTRTHVPPVLVTGGTGRVGSAVVGLLVDAGVPVRVLTRRSEAAAMLPADVEVVTGDLTVPESGPAPGGCRQPRAPPKLISLPSASR
jgi:nucleoside-diphosphate-sugar epimerase